MNRERFAKLANMMTSDNDAEALAALRKCNEMLKSENKIWKDILIFPLNQFEKDTIRKEHKSIFDDDRFDDLFDNIFNERKRRR
ncbi:hypothetical protein phi1422_0039 [Bdellovibrio phage phi1422]|uniref:hypothetical protein n=1 Tax=Bdellovibrio phage phi1422 TaxID=1127515 RepID=UPI0002536D5B|nr:hypothetical protein F395_gp39 [Bdellovibrio phage phi1422]AFC22559.1 hypothetical protein phi1422_0039 [Bdellovibrio phage phi1422]